MESNRIVLLVRETDKANKLINRTSRTVIATLVQTEIEETYVKFIN